MKKSSSWKSVERWLYWFTSQSLLQKVKVKESFFCQDRQVCWKVTGKNANIFLASRHTSNILLTMSQVQHSGDIFQ